MHTHIAGQAVPLTWRTAVLAATIVAATGALAQGSLTDPRSSISPAARAAFAERVALIDRYLAAIDRGADASSTTTAQVVWLREALSLMPLDTLRNLPPPTSYSQASRDVSQARDAQPAAIGSASTELVYFPIVPCRYIDTRFVGGMLNGTRTYDLSFTGGAFGGSAGCDPKSAVGGNEDNIGALAVNIAILSPPGAPGFVGARTPGSTALTALVNWHQANAQASNAAIVTTDQSVQAAEIELFGGPAHVVVDVFGVFAAPTSTGPSCTAGALATATLNTTTRNFNLTAGACPANYTVSSVNCGVVSGDYLNGNLRQSERGVNAGPVTTCSGRYYGSTTVTVSAQAWCCRVPGR